MTIDEPLVMEGTFGNRQLLWQAALPRNNCGAVLVAVNRLTDFLLQSGIPSVGRFVREFGQKMQFPDPQNPAYEVIPWTHVAKSSAEQMAVLLLQKGNQQEMVLHSFVELFGCFF